MTQRYHNVQALRGVAALLIVLLHARVWDYRFTGGVSHIPGFSAIDYFGAAGVDLFFVLSGFIITATNRRDFGRPAAVPGYLFRRAWRVYPTYWAALVLIVATTWACFGELCDDESPRVLLEILTLAPLPSANPLLNPAWTLTYELMFYAAFGVLLCLPARAAAVGLGAWAVVVAAGGFAPLPTNPWAVHPLSPFVFEFLGGCLVACLAGRGVRGWARTAFVAGLAWATVGSLLLAGFLWVDVTGVPGQRLRVVAYGPAAALIVYAAVATEGRLPRRVPRWLLLSGDASYSLYLTHYSVLYVCYYVGTKVPHNRLPHLLGTLTIVAAAVAVGLLFHALVERPLLNLAKRRRVGRPDTPAAPAEFVSTRRAA